MFNQVRSGQRSGDRFSKPRGAPFQKGTGKAASVLLLALAIVLAGAAAAFWFGESRTIRIGVLVVIVAMMAVVTAFVLGLNRRRRQAQWELRSELTERKRTEEKLRDSEQQHRAIFESTADALLIFDLDGAIVEANPAACATYGYSYDEMIDLSGGDIVHPDHYRLFGNFKEQIKTTGQFFTESVDVRKDGSAFNVEVRGSAFTFKGKPHLLAAVRDVTDRKKAEERLRRLAMIAEQAAEGIAVADLDGVLQFANTAWAGMHGYDSRNEFVGKPLSILHTQEQMETDVIPFNEQVKRKGYHKGEVGHVRKDGNTFPTEMAVTLFRDEAGEPIGLVAFATDITERKRAEEELRQAKEAAERANSDLAETNRQLEAAIERANQMAVAAEMSDGTKSEFLANMSHEIRTPLTAIMGYTELMMDPDQDADERMNYLVTVHRNGEHLLALINDILDISKIEAGKLTIESRRFGVQTVVAAVVSMMRARAEQRGISLTTEYTGPLPEKITSDEARLRQALINLVGNAVKFTETGGVRVVISFLPKWRQDQPAVRIKVIDTGIGIAPENLEHLFQPFVQADASTSRKYGGTGLGLAITCRIADLINGELTAESTLGHGSTFTITIPTGDLEGVKMLQNPAEVVVRESARSQAPPSDALAGGRILLAEDGPDNMRLITTILRKAGAEVAGAENGRIAAEMALAEKFDVILMDMQMPEMDGYQATSYLRSRGYGGPIIALTAHAMASDRDRCLTAGCDDYLPKPIDRAGLIACVAKHLDAAGEQRRTAPSRDSGEPDELPEPIETAQSSEPTGPRGEDAGIILSDFADDPDLTGIIDEFVVGLPDQLEQMRRAAAHADHERLRRLAHQLKGAGGSYGYSMLTDAAGALEDAAKAGDVEAANLALKRMTGLCEAVAHGRSGADFSTCAPNVRQGATGYKCPASLAGPVPPSEGNDA